ncbi:MAG: EAL domain-containing protein, partial [Alphaproteobacteria bacterium]|nr:EAL domain-containing protein [Alphaproteobacteria bacterium]
VKQYIAAGHDDDLCDWYDLDQDLDRFLKMIGHLKDPVEQKLSVAPSLKSMVNDLKDQLSDRDDNSEPQPQPAEVLVSRYIPRSQQDIAVVPMGPVQLDQLERNLINMEIFRMMADQPAYVIVGKSKPQPIFVEYYISVEEIRKKLLPGYDMLADKWLFQRLTRTFDRKLLQALIEKDLPPGQAISVNINVETVFTPVFDDFISKLRTGRNQPLIFEMQLFDVISDIQKFYDARDKLARAGCRISLDAMDINALMVLDRELLEVDFLKIGWNADYKMLLGGPMEDKIISAIAAQGKMRIILCHCDTEDALEFGKAVGIHMYQGFLTDKKFGS